MHTVQDLISRGGASAKNYTTSALNNHLQYKHPDEHKAVKLAVNVKKSLSAAVPSDDNVEQKQPTLAEFTAKRKTRAIDSAEATRVSE